jgi:hypothetical protein
MNNNVKALPNGDFIVMSTASKEPGLPPIEVTYKDLFMDKTRTRNFNNIDQALEFIKMRAWSKHLYNNFTLTLR